MALSGQGRISMPSCQSFFVHHRIYTWVRLRQFAHLLFVFLQLRMTRCNPSLSVVFVHSRRTYVNRPVLIDLLNKNNSRSWEVRLSWGQPSLADLDGHLICFDNA